jgi:hypothetical protein
MLPRIKRIPSILHTILHIIVHGTTYEVHSVMGILVLNYLGKKDYVGGDTAEIHNFCDGSGYIA